MISRIVYALTGGATALLAATGFWSWLAAGPITGWPLLIHVMAAPMLLVGLAWFVIAEAPRYAGKGRSAAGRAFFWLTATSGWFACAVIVSAMFPWFGSDAQETIYSLHRWSALVFIAAAAGLTLTWCRLRGLLSTQAGKQA